MSFSPATPEKGRRGLPTGNGGRVMPESVRFRQLVAPIEPSPASTYGETAVGESSVPPTPQELEFINAKIAAAARATKPLNLTPLLRNGTENGALSTVAGPTDVSHLPGLRQVPAPRQLNISLLAGSSRNRNADRVETRDKKQSREGSDTNESSSSHRASNAWIPISPAARLGYETTGVTSQAGPSSFVLHSQESRDNDPFVSPHREASIRRGTATSSRHGYITPSGHSSETNHSDEASVGVASNEPNEERPSSHSDESGQIITPENAQKVLRPSACVFVANLKSACTDDELYNAVHEVFKAFGDVFIKIRRDDRGMPYAFCQYKHDDDARKAIIGGRSQEINGRACRTEPARVNRSVYLSRLTGGPVSEAEAREVLSRHGEIEHCWFSSDTEREMYQLPEGVWARFSYFQDSRDALNALRSNNTYRLEQPPSAVLLQRRATGVRPGAPRLALPLSQRFASMTLRGAVVPVNYRRSIFIGNLSPATTEARITQVCTECGQVQSVEFVSKPSTQRNGQTVVYAFVQFAHEEHVSRAIYQLNGRRLDGRMIRVEARETPEQRAQRVPRIATMPIQRYTLPTQRPVPQVQRVVPHVNVESPVHGHSTQTQLVPGTVIPRHLYQNVPQEHAGTPHIPMSTAATTASTPVQFSPYTQPSAASQQTPSTTPVQNLAHPGYSYPGYYLNGNDASAQIAHWWQTYAPFSNPQYAPYWAVGYYPYPMQNGTQNNDAAPAAALTGSEPQSLNDTSAADHGQEVNASSRPE